MPDAALAASYAYCRRITRAAARNFYYAIFLLPHAKRDALCALYAFMRRADDICDLPGDAPAKLEQLRTWRGVLDGHSTEPAADDASLAAFRDTVERYAIPPRYLHDLVSGTEMDLSITRYSTFAALREYCYRVAGTVGLCCIHVFGFRDPRAPELAVKLGIAFQLTNILRDIRPDAAMGRVYLPQDELQRFSLTDSDLLAGTAQPGVTDFMAFQTARAWSHYEEGWKLVPLIEADSRPALGALIKIYSSLLRKIEDRDYNVFSGEVVRLSRLAKTAVMLRALAGGWNPEDERKAIEDRRRDRRRPGGAVVGRRAG